MRKYLIFTLFFSIHQLHAHNRDTVVMSNQHVVIGEIKGMEFGVLTMETEYSDDDFAIEWEQVVGIRSPSEFIVMLTNKYRIEATLSMDKYNPEYLIISQVSGSRMFAKFKDVVYLKSSDENFWDRLTLDINGGYNYTRASNTSQLSINGKATYTSTRISSDLYASSLSNRVTQDTTEISTVRNNYGTTWKVFLKKSWYIYSSGDFLQSEEQNLKLRTTAQVGYGRMLVRNNIMYFGTSSGFALNTERFENSDKPGQSFEAFILGEANVYGIKDFRFEAKVQFYPSLTVKNRYRGIYTLDTRYDLPLDFYVGINATINYDNQPSEDAHKYDSVFQSVVGWTF